MKPLFLIGYMGCGKTTVGQELARLTGLRFIDLDEFIEKKQGKTIEKIFDEMGEKKFRELETEALNQVAKMKNVIVACGGGTPCHGFNMELMNEMGTTIWLHTSSERITARLLLPDQKAKRPKIAYISPEDVLPLVERELEERTPFYSQANLFIDSTDVDTAEGTERTVRDFADTLGLI